MTVQEWLGKDNQLGIDIWERKYRYNNETFDEWLDRVSGGDEDLRGAIKERKFLFGGRTLANRNTGKKGSFSNCYSRGFVEDNLEDLMQAGKDIAFTFKAQGGQGISLSKLRPKGCGINNGQFVSDGIVPFMEIYNRITESISQGGSRKGALIMTLDAWHKEAADFIKIKSEEGRIEKANLSLEIDDEFMECVKKYYDSGEVVKRTISKDYDGNKIEYEVVPIELYKLMMEKAYDWGEPGCIYTDRFRNYNLMQYVDEYQIETCNPCGEQPLPKHGACNLGSINLSEFVINPFTKDAYFDATDFARVVRIAVRALDTVLDENVANHALKEQREMAEKYRNIGLGVAGMHDMLIKLGKTYGGPDSILIVDSLMNLMFKTAFITSGALAKEKGCFPQYDSRVLTSGIVRQHFTPDELQTLNVATFGLRNCSLLSVAPTGSIGTMLNISTGCEPIFQHSYRRKTESLKGEETYYDVYAGVAKEYFEKYPLATELPSYFVTSSDIKWKDRIDMQAALQEHVDTAISSTINLPCEISQDEVETLYLYAWERGLKGVTIFRSGCKKAAILTTTTTQPENKKEQPKDNIVDNPSELPRGYITKVSDDLIGYKRKLNTGCGSIHFEVYSDETTGEPQETFINIGSSGGCERNYQFISRLISLALRAGVPIEAIIDQAMSIRPCSAYVNRTKSKGDTSKGTSCPSAIGHALKELHEKMQEAYMADDEVEVEEEKTQPIQDNKNENSKIMCPECGNELIFEGGCNICKNCGWSKCD